MINKSLPLTRPTPVGRPIGVADLFKIGIGPSSSHTMGPMRAAATFIANTKSELQRATRLKVTVYGSLAWTGKGHATDKAIILGLAGKLPDQIDPDQADQTVARIRIERRLHLSADVAIDFDPETDIMFDRVRVFDEHPNAMQFEAYDETGNTIAREVWFSVGGGFVTREGGPASTNRAVNAVPFPYANAAELLFLARHAKLQISEVVLANELTQCSEALINALLDRVADTMLACIDRGLANSGHLPGSLKVKRRSKDIYERLSAKSLQNQSAPHEIMEYVSAFAMAVNEENAAGGRVVTAPTNGAAGVMPAVLRYYRDFCVGATREGMRTYLLVATAFGGIIKCNASISGAEVGC
jgi:L-serine dehydratase